MIKSTQKKNQSKSGLVINATDRANSIFRQPYNNVSSNHSEDMGNQAMLNFIQTCSLSLPKASMCPFGGICNACPAKIQAKLKVGQPGDIYEQEADRVAEMVMNMPEARTNSESNINNVQSSRDLKSCTACETVRRPAGEEDDNYIRPKLNSYGDHPVTNQCPVCDEQLQKKQVYGNKCGQNEINGGELNAPISMNSQIEDLKCGGQPLPGHIRYFIESRLGFDFGKVRTHSDMRSANTARILNARAFTIGKDIVFGAGQYSPETAAGKKLLAHELVHVVQQNNKIAMKPYVNLKSPVRIARACCDDALTGGLDAGDWGGIICCRNTKHNCVWQNNINARVSNATARGIIGRCVWAHESTHLNDVDCTSAALERPPFKAGKNPAVEERAAYRAEAACYRLRINSCGSDAQCRTQVQNELTNAESRS